MVDRITQLIRMLDGMGEAQQKTLLAGLARRDPALARRLRERQFAFDDLQHADDRGLQALIAKVDRRLALLALRGVDDAVLQAFVRNLSATAGRQLVEDVEAQGPKRRSDIEIARQAVVREALALRRQGKLTVQRPGVDDKLV